jgi:hypothetical protein
MPSSWRLVAVSVLLAGGLVVGACLAGPWAWMFDEDRAAAARDTAVAALAAGDPVRAQESIQVALAALQAARGDAASLVGDPAAIDLARVQARAAIAAADLVGGAAALGELLRLDGDNRALRHEAASALFHLAWGMRLEGAARDEWMPVAEEARQHFRLLAETAPAGDAGAASNLEATLRLQRMDLSELQGLPLPKDCKGCKNLSQRQRKQRQSAKCQEPGKAQSEKPADARQEIRDQHDRGANAEDPDSGGGS